MPKLKLSTILDDSPVKVPLELPAEVHRDLVRYAELMSRDSGRTIDPTKLIVPMLQRFMGTDRAFAKQRNISTDLAGTAG